MLIGHLQEHNRQLFEDQVRRVIKDAGKLLEEREQAGQTGLGVAFEKTLPEGQMTAVTGSGPAPVPGQVRLQVVLKFITRAVRHRVLKWPFFPLFFRRSFLVRRFCTLDADWFVA